MAGSPLTEPFPIKSNKPYELIIIGGGIYGACLLLTAAQAGIRCLLLEKDDFGGATSFNSLRIVHGGLRYLQKMDLKRFSESVFERRWFFQNFPDLVRPISCLMPLYGNRLMNPYVFWPALVINDMLSCGRNDHVIPGHQIPCGRIVGITEVRRIFPGVIDKGLQAGAIWTDGDMPDSQRLIIALLQWACRLGADVRNYCGVTRLITHHGHVEGVYAQDQRTQQTVEILSPTVVNAAGPWCRKIAGLFHQDFPALFHRSIAWNLLLNRPAPSQHALALTPDRPEATTYFLRPYHGLLFAGTVHEACPIDSGIHDRPMPESASIQRFLDDINRCIPGLDVSTRDILRIHAGYLPAKTQGTNLLAVRETIVDHSGWGGPTGFFSVSGVKFTTARRVAEKTLRQIFPDRTRGISFVALNRINSKPDFRNKINNFECGWMPDNQRPSWIPEMRQLIDTEWVFHLDDLLIRRTGIGVTPDSALQAAPVVCNLFGWDETRCAAEYQRIKDHFSNAGLDRVMDDVAGW